MEYQTDAGADEPANDGHATEPLEPNRPAGQATSRTSRAPGRPSYSAGALKAMVAPAALVGLSPQLAGRAFETSLERTAEGSLGGIASLAGNVRQRLR